MTLFLIGFCLGAACATIAAIVLLVWTLESWGETEAPAKDWSDRN